MLFYGFDYKSKIVSIKWVVEIYIGYEVYSGFKHKFIKIVNSIVFISLRPRSAYLSEAYCLLILN